MTPLAFALSLPVRAYRVTFSPVVGHNCRYQPTCSAYALEALDRHGGVKGGWFAVRRVCRCHPWGGSGYDPVPGSEKSGTHDARLASSGDPQDRG